MKVRKPGMSGTIPLKIRTQNLKIRDPGLKILKPVIRDPDFCDAGSRNSTLQDDPGTWLAPVHNNYKPGFHLKLDQSLVRADLEPSYDSKMLYLARIHFLWITIFSNTKLLFFQSWSLIFVRIPPKKVPTSTSKFLLIGWSWNVCERSLSGRMISDLIE